MKILYVTTIGITMTFFKHLIKELIEEGHTVDIICNEDDEKVPDCYREWECKIYHHSCSRSPLSKGNLLAIGQIKNLVKEQKYDIVHCHTPIAAMCTRLACKSLRKQGVRVIYTAHGFHFYKGAPLINWLVYYPIEKICSMWTDVLITINTEDYELAKRKMKAQKVEYVPGVGIDVEKFRNTVVDRVAKRKELGIPEDAFLLVSVGELNKNKNHEIVIRAIAKMKDENIHYVIAGEGALKKYLIDLSVELKISNKLHLLGYRDDVSTIYKTADVCCFPSIREGLPVAVLEAIAAGVPCIVGKNRGTKEIINESINGFLVDFDSVRKFTEKIEILKINKKILYEMGKQAERSAVNYDVTKINLKIKEIYFGGRKQI